MDMDLKTVQPLFSYNRVGEQQLTGRDGHLS